MDWLLQHLQLLIAGAGGIAWWLNQRRQSREKLATRQKKEERRNDPDFTERTRRIREEIQRKIGERTRGEASSTSTGQKQRKPIPSLAAPQLSKTESPPLLRTGMTPDEAERSTEMLAKQAALAEQLRQAVEIKTAALRQLRSGNEISPASKPVRAAVVADLRDVAALRRAFVLREIIGPPVALR
jgi:uncharacterized protein HemX